MNGEIKASVSCPKTYSISTQTPLHLL